MLWKKFDKCLCNLDKSHWMDVSDKLWVKKKKLENGGESITTGIR